jgi:CRP-like cAMP-binding protein
MENAYFPIIFDLGIKEPDAREDEPTALACLTDQDWQLLAEKSTLVMYDKNEIILKKGELPEAIYIIEKGHVRIERAPGNAIARRGPGAVFGEISFLESKGASASVVADGTAEVSVINKAHVEELLASMPDFAIRFYKTLAFTLAFRLRQAAERLVELS